MNTRSVLVLGSTGSVGTQALDAHRRATRTGSPWPGWPRAAGDLALLGRQVREHRVRRVAVADPVAAAARRCCRDAAARVSRCWSGPDAATELTAAAGADVVLNAITGSVGLGPTLAALRSGRDAGAGQQGVAGRRGSAGHRRGRARADRAGRLRALRAGPVPARRAGRGGGPAGADRVRRPVPRPAPRPSCTASPSTRRWPTPPGPWARWSPSTRPR